MAYENQEVEAAAEALRQKFGQLDDKRSIMRAPELTALYQRIKDLPDKQRAGFGKEVNRLKQELESMLRQSEAERPSEASPIDVTAPFAANTPTDERPALLLAAGGSTHPLSQELTKVLDIFYRMGFNAEASREIDDDYHMFTSLNFPPDHPARDDYDTFMTEDGLIAPAHTSTMQNRVLKKYKDRLEAGKGIRAVIPGRVFRNEDLDARHEHTFYQLEGVYVDEGINAGNLIATLQTYFSQYFQKDVKVKIQPFYFPFTEPSFEFAASCVFCDQKGCNICSYSGWIELCGCGMIHPNVLKEAGIDSRKYTGFAWGGGVERLVMIKYGIEDIRHFESANLKFLRQFG